MGDGKSKRCLMLVELELDTCWDWHPCSSPEGSDCVQWKIEDTAQYWVMKEKEVVTNYHHIGTEQASI